MSGDPGYATALKTCQSVSFMITQMLDGDHLIKPLIFFSIMH